MGAIVAVAVATDLMAPLVGRSFVFPWGDAVSAAAAPNSSAVTLRYHCGFPVIGSQPMVALVEWDTPPSVQVGRPVPGVALSMQATVSPQAVLGLKALSVISFDGSADVNGDIRAPQGDVPEKIALNVPKAGVPSSGSMTIPAAGTTPVVSFDRAGPASVSVGGVTMHLQGYGVGGVRLLPFDVGCTLDAGQSGIVASFDITLGGPPSATSSQVWSSPSSGPSQSHGPSSASASSPASNSSAPASVPSSATASAPSGNRPSGSGAAPIIEAIAPPSTSDTVAAGLTVPADSTPTTTPPVVARPTDTKSGVDVVDWLVLAGALLVAGTAGVLGASWLEKRRLRGHLSGFAVMRRQRKRENRGR